MSGGKNVVLVERNLFFSAKISAALKELGYGVAVESDGGKVAGRIGPETAAIIINLAALGADATAVIKNLKASPQTARVPVIGFAGHKAKELFEAAQAAGCDLVVPNSAIAGDLEGVLRKAGTNSAR